MEPQVIAAVGVTTHWHTDRRKWFCNLSHAML